MRRCIVIAILIASFTGIGALAYGQGKSQGRGRGESSNAETKPATNSGLVFGGAEVRIIRDWFSDKSNLKGLPPGLAKKDSLPPGLEKQLRRNGTLPPGLEKKLQPLPQALEVRLPPLPDGHRRVIISGTVVLLDNKRNLILDVLANVF